MSQFVKKSPKLGAGWLGSPWHAASCVAADRNHSAATGVVPMQVQSAVDIDQPLFQPYPAEVVFHSYEPFKQYEAILHLRNNDKVSSTKSSSNFVTYTKATP